MAYRVFQRSILFRSCVAIHTVSREMIDDLREFGLKHRNIHAIANGVDCERFHPAKSRSEARLACGLPPDSIVIGNVGRMFPHKRQTLLVEAFNILAEAHPRLHLLIVGDSRFGKDSVVERVEASRFKERIHLTGFQSDPVPWYQAMDLLVVSSLYEGMSNVVLEAMATGLPVIAHSACGMAEMIENGKTGLVENIETPDDLARVLTAVVDSDETRASMGAAGLSRAVETFSLDLMVENYRRLFVSCLTGQRSS